MLLREKLGVDLAFVTDRCNRLDDPWNDRAIGVHFENAEAAAHSVLQAQRELPVDGILAIGDRPGPAAAYVARFLGIYTIIEPRSKRAATNSERVKFCAMPVFLCRPFAALRCTRPPSLLCWALPFPACSSRFRFPRAREFCASTIATNFLPGQSG